jgi:SAM-dependent methyltransferase
VPAVSIEDLLKCPCSPGPGSLGFAADGARCRICGSFYPREGRRFDFRREGEAAEPGDPLYPLKRAFQRLPFYRGCVSLLGPVYGDGRRVLDFLSERAGEGKVALNLGSGNVSYGENVLNVDIVAYPNVQIVADQARLPVRDCSVDAVVSVAVLEHVPDPARSVSEMGRVLKPGGHAYCFVPFIQGYHASPGDFFRWTESGARELFKDFSVLEVRNSGGPTSALLWVAQEYFAILFSFGWRPLHRALYLAALVLTSPLKFLDALLRDHPMSKNIASGFVVVARKKGP